MAKYSETCIDCGVRFDGRKRLVCERCADRRRSERCHAAYVASVGRPVRANHCGGCGATDHNAQRCPQARASAKAAVK